MNQVLAMILAGGRGDRLKVLSEKRTKPAVPFAGKFRIIDFTLSNCVNSGMFNVAILTQYRPRSLNEHIGIGKPWDLDRKTGGVHLLQPYTGRAGSGWYSGTADAVYQNLNFVYDQKVDQALILSGDHVYKMDYRHLVRFHREHGADLTVAVMEVPIGDASRFGTLIVDGQNRVIEFEEKPERPRSNLVSMGIYVFEKRILFDRLEDDANNPASSHDFGKNVIPAMVNHDRVFAYRYRGYWRDVGTLESYYEANMDLLGEEPEINLYDRKDVIHTYSVEQAPAKLAKGASVRDSLISHGCIIEGVVEHSVLSPGVRVHPGAVVTNAIVMNDTVIHANARVDRAILDKKVVVGRRAVIGFGDDYQPNRQDPVSLKSGLTVIGRNTRAPDDVRIGRNCVIGSDLDPEDFMLGLIPSGETIPSKRQHWWAETAATRR